MMVNRSTTLMRVPKTFKDTVEKIGTEQKKNCTDILRDSERILYNANQLSRLFGRKKIR